jgi:hypothetical protein
MNTRTALKNILNPQVERVKRPIDRTVVSGARFDGNVGCQ